MVNSKDFGSYIRRPSSSSSGNPKYTPRPLPTISGLNQNQERSQREISEFRRGYSTLEELTSTVNNDYIDSNFLPKIKQNANEIVKINRSLESKLKAELSNGLSGKVEHFVKNIFSKDYRNTTAEGLIDQQLARVSTFKDAIKQTYEKMNKELNRSQDLIGALGSQRVELMKDRKDLLLYLNNKKSYLETATSDLRTEPDAVEREKLRNTQENSHREYRKGIDARDKINHTFIENVKEKNLMLGYELIFERYSSAFEKIHTTAESEVRKIHAIKGLYMQALKGGQLINNLEDQFNNIFGSLQTMDTHLLSGINNVLATSRGEGQIEILRDRQSENQRQLGSVIRDGFVPQAEELDRMVGLYIYGNSNINPNLENRKGGTN